MTDRSSAELERDAEKIRADIANTTERLRDKMSPGQMVDEVTSYLKDSDSSLALHNLGRQARDNPMALALVGAGFAWLMMGSGTRDRGFLEDDYEPRYEPSRYRSGLGAYGGGPDVSSFDEDEDVGVGAMTGSGVGSDEPGLATTYPGDLSGEPPPSSSFVEPSEGGSMGDRIGGAAASAREGAGRLGRGASDRASEFGRGVSDRASRLGRGASDRARRLGSRTSEAGHRFAEDARDYAEYGRRSALDAIDREPLILGAIGVAVGAAIGAMLPRTRYEDEHLGDMRDRLGAEAGRALNRAVDDAKDVAGEAYSAASAASREEGLTPEGKPFAERVGNVAKAAGSAAGDRASEKLRAEESAARDQLASEKAAAEERMRSSTQGSSVSGSTTPGSTAPGGAAMPGSATPGSTTPGDPTRKP